MFSFLYCYFNLGLPIFEFQNKVCSNGEVCEIVPVCEPHTNIHCVHYERCSGNTITVYLFIHCHNRYTILENTKTICRVLNEWFFLIMSKNHNCGASLMYPHVTGMTCILWQPINCYYRYHCPIKWPESMRSWTITFWLYSSVIGFCCKGLIYGTEWVKFLFLFQF